MLYAARAPIDEEFVRRLATVHGLDQFPHHRLSGPGGYSFAVPYTSDLVASVPKLQRLVSLQGWDHQPPNQASIKAGYSTAAGWTHLGDRTAQAARARDALIELAPDVDQAFAEGTTGKGWWGPNHSHRKQRLSGESLLQRPALVPHRVIDAHGLQVLTGHHLERASSLRDWHTRQIGDRYLLEARDLDPWFAGDEPDPEVLAKARVDFGEMIMSRPEFDALLVAEHEESVRAYQERVARGEAT